MSILWGRLRPGQAVLCIEPEDKQLVITKILLVNGNILSLVTDKMFPPSDLRFLDASIESQDQYTERIRQERKQEGS